MKKKDMEDPKDCYLALDDVAEHVVYDTRRNESEDRVEVFVVDAS